MARVPRVRTCVGVDELMSASKEPGGKLFVGTFTSSSSWGDISGEGDLIPYIPKHERSLDVLFSPTDCWSLVMHTV